MTSPPFEFPNDWILHHNVYGVGIKSEDKLPTGSILMRFYGTGWLRLKTKDVRRTTFREFCLWRHPDGGWQHGKNSAWWALLVYLAGVGMLVAAATGAGWIIGAFGIAVPGLMLFGTYQNWRGRWV